MLAIIRERSHVQGIFNISTIEAIGVLFTK